MIFHEWNQHFVGFEFIVYSVFVKKKSKLLPLTHLEQAKFEASDKYIDHQECTNNETEAILK